MMKGKVVLMTGATSGIGRVAAERFASMGATLVVVARDKDRGKDAVSSIIEGSGNNDVEFLLADLSSQEEVRRLATGFKNRHDRLDVLINNAATVPSKRHTSPDGHELQWSVNHLAYFLLTHLLLDRILSSAPSRIVNTSSGIHTRGPLDFNDLQSEHGYKAFRTYGRTKLANVYFTYELAERLKATGSGVTVNCWTPGFTKTGLGRDFNAFMRFGMRLFGKSPSKGAETLIYLASSPEVRETTGKYFKDGKAVRSAEFSYDREATLRLWRVSERMTGLTDFWDDAEG